MSNIFYLVHTDHSGKAENIMALSYDKKILENIKQSGQTIKENLPIYRLWKTTTHPFGYRLMSLKSDEINKKNRLKMYAFTNYFNNNEFVEDCIVDLYAFFEDTRDVGFFKDNLSANEILFDIYYDEGVMNA
jgi:hypothetical protein